MVATSVFWSIIFPIQSRNNGRKIAAKKWLKEVLVGLRFVCRIWCSLLGLFFLFIKLPSVFSFWFISTIFPKQTSRQKDRKSGVGSEDKRKSRLLEISDVVSLRLVTIGEHVVVDLHLLPLSWPLLDIREHLIILKVNISWLSQLDPGWTSQGSLQSAFSWTSGPGGGQVRHRSGLVI